VKWRGLSYSQATWEPESLIKTLFEERIQDYSRYNRSLDQFQRDRLDHLIKNHKKMLRITEKKYQGQGNKKIDPIQENLMSI
jgi:chromodomain-helicase-DNA-binding protein 7